jgi:hypothetical protein
MTDDTPLRFDLPSVCRKEITVDFKAVTNLPTAGCCCCGKRSACSVCGGGFANTMTDRRDPNRVRHEMLEW